jgi:hypothetical protein
MSGHVRFGFAAFLLVAGISTPAVSNPLTDLFTPNPAPEAAAAAPAAPAPAPDACLRQPGPAASGGHWVYRYDGHRKCWFQAEGGGAVARKPVRHQAARRSTSAPEQDQSAPRQQENVEDARAEMPGAAPAQTPQVAPPEPKLTIVHTIPVRVADAAAQVPPPPDLSKPDQPAPDQQASRQLDAETLLAKAPAPGEEVASAPPSTPVAAPTASTGGIEAWTASWLGVVLMALGGAALLSSSRTLRRALWPVRSPDSPTDLPDFAPDSRHDPSFGERIAPAGGRRDGLLHYDAQSVAPLAHAAHPRRSEAPEVPAQEALWDDGIGALAALASPVSPQAFAARRGAAYRGAE